MHVGKVASTGENGLNSIKCREAGLNCNFLSKATRINFRKMAIFSVMLERIVDRHKV